MSADGEGSLLSLKIVFRVVEGTACVTKTSSFLWQVNSSSSLTKSQILIVSSRNQSTPSVRVALSIESAPPKKPTIELPIS